MNSKDFLELVEWKSFKEHMRIHSLKCLMHKNPELSLHLEKGKVVFGVKQVFYPTSQILIFQNIKPIALKKLQRLG